MFTRTPGFCEWLFGTLSTVHYVAGTDTWHILLAGEDTGCINFEGNKGTSACPLGTYTDGGDPAKTVTIT